MTHRGIKGPAQIGALLRAIESHTSRDTTPLALTLAPLVFLRPGELRRADRAHIDFEEAQWRVPHPHEDARPAHLTAAQRSVPRYRRTVLTRSHHGA